MGLAGLEGKRVVLALPIFVPHVLQNWRERKGGFETDSFALTANVYEGWTLKESGLNLDLSIIEREQGFSVCRDSMLRYLIFSG